MKRYVDYCTSRTSKHIVSFGLGDWCHFDRERMVDPALTSTAYYYTDVNLLARFANLTGHERIEEHYSRLATSVRIAFNSRFYRGNGIYGGGEPTAMGTALYHGLVEDAEKPLVVKQLAALVTANGCKADFGILGAKYIPRVLAANGLTELALKLILQPEYPGWMYHIDRGATTLYEDWHGKSSRNHIMFGDVSAWMFSHLAGIATDPERPGFAHVNLSPVPVATLKWVKAVYQAPSGRIVSAWRHEGDRCEFEIEIPPGTTGTLNLPGQPPLHISAGTHRYSFSGKQ